MVQGGQDPRPHLETGVPEIVAGFNADLLDGYEAQFDTGEPEWLRLSVRKPDGAWQPGPSRGSDDVLDAEKLGWMVGEVQGEIIEHTFGHAWARCPFHGGPSPATAAGRMALSGCRRTRTRPRSVGL
jgi:hypothetical protein